MKKKIIILTIFILVIILSSSIFSTRSKALETYCTLEKTDTYTLKADYSDFVGSYKVTVYEAD